MFNNNFISVFSPRAAPSPLAQEPRLQLCRRQVFHRKLGNQGCSFTRLCRCGNFPLLSAPHSLLSIWTDFKRSEKIPGTLKWRWGEWICLTEPSGLHRNSPQVLNISSIRVFGQIRDPEIPFAPCSTTLNWKRWVSLPFLQGNTSHYCNWWLFML